MAVNDDSTGFSYLAMVRYMVATVVSLLAGVVIVMVITVDVLHPEQISVSVLQGHVDMTVLWTRTETVVRGPPEPGMVPVHGRPNPGVLPVGGEPEPWLAARPRGETTGWGHGNRVEYKYRPVEYVDFGITLRMDDPSGRANIHCKDLLIRFFDTPYGGVDNFTVGTELCLMNMTGDRSFVVKKKSSLVLIRWTEVTSKTVLSNLASTYAGRSSFTGAVKVAMSISSDTLFGRKRTDFRDVNHFCGPLTFSVDEPSRTDLDVTCVETDPNGRPLF